MDGETDQQKQRNELKERQMEGQTDQQKRRYGLKDRQIDGWRTLQTNSKRQTVYTKIDSPSEKEAKREKGG